MYARMLEGLLANPNGKEAVVYLRLSLGPALRRQPGFRGGRFVTDIASGQGLLLLLWETES